MNPTLVVDHSVSGIAVHARRAHVVAPARGARAERVAGGMDLQLHPAARGASEEWPAAAWAEDDSSVRVDGVVPKPNWRVALSVANREAAVRSLL